MTISAVLNFTMYFGTNRSYIVETALTTIFLIIIILPKYRKRILIVTMPIACLIIFSMFVTKQFGIEESSEFNSEMVSLQEFSNIIEEVLRFGNAQIAAILL